LEQLTDENNTFLGIKITPPLLSIIIVSYNDKEGILRCLQSIYHHHTTSYYEIIIIDNHSIDGSPEEIKRQYPEVILIENNANMGSASAINQGIKQAGGKYLLFLNPDTEFQYPVLDSFVKKAEKNKNVGIWGPKIIDQNGNPVPSCWPFPTIWSLVGEIFYCPLLQNSYSHREISHPEFEPDILSGAALFIRQNILNIISGFDEQFFWMEDADLCFRATQKGIKKQYCNDLEIIHYGGSSASQHQTITIANQVYSKVKFFKKHFSFPHVVIVLFLEGIHVGYKLILFSILAPFKKVYRDKARAYLYTLVHFPSVFRIQPVLFD